MKIVQWSLRPSVPDDLHFVFQLNKQNMRHYVEKIRGWDDEAEWQDMKSKFQPGHDRIIVVGKEDSGVLAVDTTDKEIFLRHIELLPRYHNIGIGTMLIQQLLNRSKKTGRSVRLTVLKDNPAVRLYQRLGFVITKKMPLKYEMTAKPTSR
ncbi:GNAT family N-acetyltransferase [Kroppenstedtia pulmonis]|uniref:GNAT family N-acetyltransferase n=1 Tax=Kroppenstedtia pulmonis TaxID=1380685 RepID=A0A7D4B301_9BACL|nr:GNAT family N-acetyltransferase [Kroppenstedtia pulmonis]QKG84886.1 GNAT family N-acetyltransferase [Kroppenstedtia pulmonis]